MGTNACGWTASNTARYTETGQNPTNTMSCREPLPDDCPPDEADEITVPLFVYRLVRSMPPTGDGFRSRRAERPARIFCDVTEYQSVACRYSPPVTLPNGCPPVGDCKVCRSARLRWVQEQNASSQPAGGLITLGGL